MQFSNLSLTPASFGLAIEDHEFTFSYESVDSDGFF